MPQSRKNTDALCSVAVSSFSTFSAQLSHTTMDDERIQSPPPKRRCTRDTDHDNGHDHALGSTFWFADGDFVLRVENHQFKVHQERLQSSDIFSDMLALPQPSKADVIDGCAFVELMDSAADWVVALKCTTLCKSFPSFTQSMRLFYSIGSFLHNLSHLTSCQGHSEYPQNTR